MSLFGCDHAPLIAQLRADLAYAEADAAKWESVYNTERARYDELLQTVLAMKAAGAQVVPVAGSAVEPAATPEPAKPDALKALIHSLAPDDTRKRGMMLRQLAVDRAGGMGEEQIEQAIRDGIPSDGVPS